MTEENSHEDDELLAIDPDEELANDASNTDDDELFESSDNSEESQGKPEKPTAEKIRQKQVRAWRNKIEDGEATIEDLPPNQKWIAKYLETDKTVAPVSDEELDRRLEEKLNAREEEKQFKSMLDELNEMGLSNKKRAALNAEYKSLREDGVSRVKALEKAKRLAGVEVQSRYGGTLPVVGSYAPKQRDEDLTSEQRVARLEEMRKKRS